MSDFGGSCLSFHLIDLSSVTFPVLTDMYVFSALIFRYGCQIIRGYRMGVHALSCSKLLQGWYAFRAKVGDITDDIGRTY